MYAPTLIVNKISDIHVRNQLSIGLQDQQIQTDILAKATQLKSLADIIKHAEALEAATRDQSSITAANETINRVSDYRRNKNQKSWSTQKHDHQHKHPPCIGCGSTEHGSHERQRKCPEWNKTCQSCFKPNHNSSVCRSKRVSSQHESTNAVLIARIIYDEQKQSFTLPPKTPQPQLVQATSDTHIS